MITELRQLPSLAQPEKEFFLKRLRAFRDILQDDSLYEEIVTEVQERRGQHVTETLARKLEEIEDPLVLSSLIRACRFLLGEVHSDLDLPVDTILQLYMAS